MKKTFLIFVTISLLSVDIVTAQEVNDQPWNMNEAALLDGKTIIKANTLGWITRNFGFYGERVINKNISAVLGINFMPKGSIPFIGIFTEEKTVKDVQVNSFAFTPEVRFYLGKSGYGRGFYIGPYYKYEHFNADNYTVFYRDENNINQSVTLDGKLNTHSVGAVIGAQWLLGKNKNIVLDWTIIGAHYGANRGTFNGETAREISEEEQVIVKNELEEAINNLELGNKKIFEAEGVTVNSHSAQANVKSPWTLFRMAFSVGYRF